MKITIEDIEIFITTYNRADYLEQSLKSILAQTAGVKNVTILDNNSTDNTEEVVKKYESSGVKYVKTFGFLGNFKKAKEIVSKKYCMLFHDDDILHPKYLEYALKALNKYKNLAIVTTRYTEFQNDDLPEIPYYISEKHYLFKTQKEFAKHMLMIQKIAYATSIYRTKYFKKTPLEYEKFSKFNDWPFMIKIAKYGKVVLFDDCNMFYARRHKLQDTNTFDNAPTLEQVVNWNKPFYDAIIGHNIFKRPTVIDKIMFMEMSLSHAYGKYKLFMSPEDKKKYSIDDLMNCIKSKGMMVKLNAFSGIKIASARSLYLKEIMDSNLNENFPLSLNESFMINIESIEYTITTNCTLKCKKCMHLINYYRFSKTGIKKNRDISLAEIERNLDKFLKCVDSVNYFVLLDGEPLIYKDLDKIMKKLVNEKKINHLGIVTNGTCVLNEKVLNISKNPKVYYEISDYGSLSVKKNELINQLKENKINFHVRAWEWKDPGDLTYRNRSKKENIILYQNCTIPLTPLILKDKIFMCPRIAHMYNLNLTKKFKNEYVNFASGIRFINRIKLHNLLNKKYMKSCNYCGGYSNAPTIQRAEQMTTEEIIKLKEKYTNNN